jgi:hypothetical protein
MRLCNEAPAGGDSFREGWILSSRRQPVELDSVDSPPNAELDAARRELQELYRQLAIPRPFSWSRMSTQRQIARLKRRIATLERA